VDLGYFAKAYACEESWAWIGETIQTNVITTSVMVKSRFINTSELLAFASNGLNIIINIAN